MMSFALLEGPPSSRGSEVGCPLRYDDPEVPAVVDQDGVSYFDVLRQLSKLVADPISSPSMSGVSL